MQVNPPFIMHLKTQNKISKIPVKISVQNYPSNQGKKTKEKPAIDDDVVSEALTPKKQLSNGIY